MKSIDFEIYEQYNGSFKLSSDKTQNKVEIGVQQNALPEDKVTVDFGCQTDTIKKKHMVNNMQKKKIATTQEIKNINTEETRQELRQKITGALLDQCIADLNISTFNFDENYNASTKFQYEPFSLQLAEIWNSAPPRPMAGYNQPTQEMNVLRARAELMIKQNSEDLIARLKDIAMDTLQTLNIDLIELENDLIGTKGDEYIMERCNTITSSQLIAIRDGSLNKILATVPIIKPLYCPWQMTMYNPAKTEEMVLADINRLKDVYLAEYRIFAAERKNFAKDALTTTLNLI